MTPAKNFKSKFTNSPRRGFSLIELVVAIALVSVSLIAMSATIANFRLRQATNYKTAAYAIAEEELAAIKTIPFANLTNVASSTFSNVLSNLGQFAVTATTASSSPPNVYAVTATGTPVNTITSLRVFPLNRSKAVSANIKVRYPANPPANWAVGLLFRAADYKNYYRLTIKSSGLELAKAVDGTVTVLSTYAFSPMADTWYNIALSTNGSSITSYVNGINVGTVVDASLTSGEVALVAQNNLKPLFDDCDVAVDGNATSTWKFDTEPVNADSVPFKQFGVYSLPSGRDELTVENYLGQTDFKKITVAVYWTERGAKKAIMLSTLRNN